jgi:MFS family permease
LAPAAKAKLSNLDRFLVSYFLYTFALYGASSYLSLYMKSLGASPRWITATFAAGVVSEVLVMSRVGRWTDLYGRRPALAAAFLLMPVRLLFYIPAAAGPVWVLLVQTLHGLNFGIVGAVAVAFVNDHASERERGSLQARLAATAGLALATSPVACGWIAQRFSIAAMFGAMSLIGAVGAAFFLAYVGESHPEPTVSRWRIVRALAGDTRA